MRDIRQRGRSRRPRQWHTDRVENAVLVYDGDCAFCRRCVRFIERRVKRHPRLVAWQATDLDALGLTADQCREAVQWVGPDGRHEAAHRAVARTLVGAGSGWALLGRVLLLPGVVQLAGVVYRWVARNRHRLPGGTVECSLDDRIGPARGGDRA